MVLTPLNIFKNKGNVEWKFKPKFDSTHFQQTFQQFLRFQQCWMTCSNAHDIWFNNCVERMLKQMLKPFKRALRIFTFGKNAWENSAEPAKGVMCWDCTVKNVLSSNPDGMFSRDTFLVDPSTRQLLFSSTDSRYLDRKKPFILLKLTFTHPSFSQTLAPWQLVFFIAVAMRRLQNSRFSNWNYSEQVNARKLELTRPEAPKAWILNHDRRVSLWCETLITVPHS